MNGDGSVDIYFSPKPPAGQETNWVPTNAAGQFEVLFRFYGPGETTLREDVEAAGHREGEMNEVSP